MSDDIGWQWLESTKWLQETAFHIDFSTLRGHALADYILMNAYSVNDEISEATGEFRWKPWDRQRGTFIDRDAFVHELVDAAHFIANMAVAAGVTDEEWERLYRGKQERNVKRQKHGYDAVGSKCPDCKRELDKPGAVKIRVALKEHRGDARIGVIVCTFCGRRLGMGLPSGELAWDPWIDVPQLRMEDVLVE